ncbi:MAG: hypothetical protein Fur0022_25080 [Anaerolineales bacterium]
MVGVEVFVGVDVLVGVGVSVGVLVGVLVGGGVFVGVKVGVLVGTVCAPAWWMSRLKLSIIKGIREKIRTTNCFLFVMMAFNL